mmetsp:Transcript_29166/g.76545  ORF Transcript_29166/g.76545 Transcript_29166/m.76545 type:complete len:227 (+) Transcript_29166:170-850(+)
MSTSKSSCAVLSKQQVLDIFVMRSKSTGAKRSVSACEIADVFGVSPKTIRDIWNERTWYQETLAVDPFRIPDETRLMKRPGRPKGSRDSYQRQKKADVRLKMSQSKRPIDIGSQASPTSYEQSSDETPYAPKYDENMKNIEDTTSKAPECPSSSESIDDLLSNNFEFFVRNAATVFGFNPSKPTNADWIYCCRCANCKDKRNSSPLVYHPSGGAASVRTPPFPESL